MADLTSAISVQVDSKDKAEVTKILKQLGISMSGLINMTFKQVIINKGIPFELTTKPRISKDLKEALDELEYMEKHLDEYPKFDNWKDLKESLLSDDEN